MSSNAPNGTVHYVKVGSVAACGKVAGYSSLRTKRHDDVTCEDCRRQLDEWAGVRPAAPVVMTVPECAKRLNVSRQAVYRLITRGLLRAVRIGPKVLRVPVGAVEEMLNETHSVRRR